MKKYLLRFAAICLTAITVAVLPSCGDDGPDDPNNDVTQAVPDKATEAVFRTGLADSGKFKVYEDSKYQYDLVIESNFTYRILPYYNTSEGWKKGFKLLGSAQTGYTAAALDDQTYWLCGLTAPRSVASIDDITWNPFVSSSTRPVIEGSGLSTDKGIAFYITTSKNERINVRVFVTGFEGSGRDEKVRVVYSSFTPAS